MSSACASSPNGDRRVQRCAASNAAGHFPVLTQSGHQARVCPFDQGSHLVGLSRLPVVELETVPQGEAGKELVAPESGGLPQNPQATAAERRRPMRVPVAFGKGSLELPRVAAQTGGGLDPCRFPGQHQIGAEGHAKMMESFP